MVIVMGCGEEENETYLRIEMAVVSDQDQQKEYLFTYNENNCLSGYKSKETKGGITKEGWGLSIQNDIGCRIISIAEMYPPKEGSKIGRKISFQRDPLGRLKNATTEYFLGETTSKETVSSQYAYDTQGRLNNVVSNTKKNSGSVPNKKETFKYTSRTIKHEQSTWDSANSIWKLTAKSSATMNEGKIISGTVEMYLNGKWDSGPLYIYDYDSQGNLAKVNMDWGKGYAVNPINKFEYEMEGFPKKREVYLYSKSNSELSETTTMKYSNEPWILNTELIKQTRPFTANDKLSTMRETVFFYLEWPAYF